MRSRLAQEVFLLKPSVWSRHVLILLVLVLHLTFIVINLNWCGLLEGMMSEAGSHGQLWSSHINGLLAKTRLVNIRIEWRALLEIHAHDWIARGRLAAWLKLAQRRRLDLFHLAA